MFHRVLMPKPGVTRALIFLHVGSSWNNRIFVINSKLAQSFCFYCNINPVFIRIFSEQRRQSKFF